MDSEIKKHSIADRIVYVFVCFYHMLSMMFPLKLWIIMGKYLGSFLFYINPHHRKIALINLRFAFGDEKTDKEIYTIAHDHFRQLGMNGHEWIRLKGLTPGRLNKVLEFVQVEGEEHIIAARKKNRSVVLLGSHFGNWEYCHLYYAGKINRLNFIVRKLDNPLLEQERSYYNEKYNVNILYKENGLRPAVKNLKKGEDLVIFADRKAGIREGIPALFFGKKTSTIPLIAALVKKYKFPIVPMFITRCDDLVHHRIIFYPEINTDNVSDEDFIDTVTQLQNDAIEKAIRQFPDHWLWIHRKWKCYHSDIYK